MINNQVFFYQSTVEIEYNNRRQVTIFENLPKNIDIFSDLVSIDNDVSLYTKKTYYKLLDTIKMYLNRESNIYQLENNLSKLRNYVDEDKEIQIEWVIRSTYRIGFLIDKDGNITFWRMYRDGNKTNTVSDSIESFNFDEKIISILNEVISLT